ncbi:uncharacterized protein LOC135704930 [Ochlerotatus camptorhynchus]|uniref:uncharacterized protein LOC135704930 n=1 Tax=Ochlerotatus camptorhynchus TaxID=644619 RepID=UPI0031E1081A
MDLFPTTRMKKCFPKRCCVSGCKTKVYDENKVNKLLFRFVQWPKSRMTESRKDLVKKRFWLWINVLGQNPRRAESLWVCHVHFVTGRPAAPSHHWEIDWVPNQNLHSKTRINDVLNDSFNRTLELTLNDVPTENTFTPEVEPPESEACHPSLDPDLEGPFCRFCFRKNVNMRPLFPLPGFDENHLIRVVEEVTCIRLEFAADYNSFICHDCQQRMEEFFGYRKMWQANDLLLRAFREKHSFVEPTPIVVIPIERLMEDPSEETNPLEALPCSKENCELAEQKPDTHEQQNYLEDEQPEQNVPIDLEDTKQPFEEISIMETTLVSDSSFTAPSVKKESQEGPGVNCTELKEKDRLIKKLMRKVRRETLSPKKRKSKDNSRRSKKHTSKQSFRAPNDHQDLDKG